VGTTRRSGGGAVGVRLVAALAGLGAVAVLLAYAAPADWPHGPGDVGRWVAAPPYEARLVALATMAAYGCLAWLAFALVAVAAGPGAARFAPAALRRLAERVLGVALATAAAGVLAAGPAAADGPNGPHGHGVPGRGAGPFDRPAAVLVTSTPTPAPTPVAPSRAPVIPPPPEPSRPGLSPGTDAFGTPHAVPDGAVVVRRGDTLWDIAERHLGPGATAAEVAAAWPRWYAANRAVVGPDPGLILPGQRLVPPAA
jgi:nucleoid-associated protein YgaU